MGKQVIGIQRKCLLKFVFVGFLEVIFQNLMKGPHFIYYASDWTSTDLVADPSVSPCVRARRSVVPPHCGVSPSCKCCIWCILLVIILVLLRCIFIKQIFTDSIVLPICCSESGLFLRVGGWGLGQCVQPAKEVQRAAHPPGKALQNPPAPVWEGGCCKGDRKCQPWAGVPASHLACH